MTEPAQIVGAPREATGPQDALRLLFWLRIVAIITQTLAVLSVHVWLDSPLPLS